MKNIRHLFTSLALALLAAAASGQISFSNQTSLLQNPNGFKTDIAVAIADMNGDGLDDIVRLNNGTQLSIEYQTADGQPFGHFSFGMVSSEGQWSMATADVNNDGYCDIISGGFYDGVHLLTAMNNGTGYQAGILPGDGIFLQGSNFADVNNDGHLDIFGCHDDGESHLWMNDGTGTFPAEANNSVINFDVTPNDLVPAPSNDDSGNYGSVWTDFDNDGDLDLYIAKCRQGVENPEDPRRINVLFVNDGQGNYSEQGEKHGLRIKWQSWTADFQDIDNDGDMDCFVTNHDYPMQLLENDGAGNFTDITEQAGVAVNGYFWEGIMRDFDNDGFVDILTATATFLFKNNGDKTFTQVPNPFGGELSTFAAGDLNSDGFQDLYVGYESNMADRLLLNSTNNGYHFLGVRLQGVQSNKAGVGSRIEIHGNWGVQVREIRSGESYGISNSLTQHFGLGQETVIDYLVVRWSSGVVDVVKNPAADQFLTIVEGSTCALSDFEIELSGPNILCEPGDSITLSAPAGYQYLWSNGMNSPSLTVGGAGNFSLIVVDSNGCAARSNVVKIVVNPDQTPTVEATGVTSFCEGGSVVLTASVAPSYAWSNGEISQSITVAQSGNYFVTVPGICQDFSSQAIQVDVFPVAAAPQVTGDTVLVAGAATLVAVGTNLRWFDSPVATQPLAVNDTLVTPTLTQTDTFYVEAVNAVGGGDFEAGMPEHQGTKYSGVNFNGQTIFNVDKPLILKQVTVYTDSIGERVIQLLDQNNQVVASKSFDLQAGQITLDLDFFVPAGNNYKLTTQTSVNQQNWGINSPILRRSDAGVSYPYIVPGVISITGSNYGNSFYYYFFDWQVEQLPLYECVSERLPVVATVLPSGTDEEVFFGEMNVQPNPSNGLFLLDFQPIQGGETTLTVTDLAGKTVFEKTFSAVKNEQQQEPVNLSGKADGVYFLLVTNGERGGKVKLVKN